ncbi:MAG: T9SS type A sorting domain-containing protein [FCB group bacterium]|nr:T9SS type A sorting domain-containing protein [FCB group bacterium]
MSFIIICKSSGPSTNGFRIEIISGGDRRVRFGGQGSAGESNVYSTTTIPDTSDWYHVAGVKDGDIIRIYINGIEEGSNTGFGNPSISGSLGIGDWIQAPSDHRFFPEVIDEARLWNDARTPDEILANYLQELTGNEENLVAYYKFNEGAGNYFIDSSPNNNNGTLYEDFEWVTADWEPWPSLNVTLTPAASPVIIPETGGVFDFNIAVANNTLSIQIFDIWTEVIYEQWSIEILDVSNLSIPGNITIDRDKQQVVPASAPGGIYQYHAYVGDKSAWEVWDSDSFPFEKLGGDGWFGSNNDWLCSGEVFSGESPVSKMQPIKLTLNPPSPNPFNPSTTLNYSLPADADIKLKVFDVQGRYISTLAEGYRQTGTYSVVFDGAKLASGIYFDVLQAGNITHTQKLILLK